MLSFYQCLKAFSANTLYLKINSSITSYNVHLFHRYEFHITDIGLLPRGHHVRSLRHSIRSSWWGWVDFSACVSMLWWVMAVSLRLIMIGWFTSRRETTLCLLQPIKSKHSHDNSDSSSKIMLAFQILALQCRLSLFCIILQGLSHY